MTSPEERRLRLILHYDGSGFHGWQVQREERTVQGELEAALERLTGARRVVTAAGRTDRGVHATGQVVSVTLPPRWTDQELRRALNAVLPPDVWVASAEEVPSDFHPRYDAVSRRYLYRIGLVERACSPFHHPWCWPLADALDVGLLDDAAALLPGEHSFAAFARAGQPERGTRCTVHQAEWSPWELGVAFHIRANRYLHHMVRYLVGTMVDVARGRRPLADLRALLEGTDPTLETSPPAPPEGLFLAEVQYPERGAARQAAPEAMDAPERSTARQ